MVGPAAATDLGGACSTRSPEDDPPEQVDGGAGVLLVDLELVTGGVLLVAADQDVDVPVEGRREEQRLATRPA